MRFKNVNLKIEGEGQSMIFLHGWQGSMQLMDPLYDYFKSKYKVCNMDLPGFGNSTIEKAYTIYDYVKVVRDIIKEYDLENPIFIAHSFGARIAFIYASVYPTSYLIITGGAGLKPKRTLDYYMQVYLYKILKFFQIENKMGSKDFQNASVLMKKTLVNVVNEDVRNNIKKITCTILLVWGENDNETPLSMANEMVKLNTNCTLVIFENDNHFAYYHQIHRFINVCEYALEEKI